MTTKIVTSRFSAGAGIILVLFGAGIGLFPPHVPNQPSSPFTDMSGRNLDLARPLRNVAVLAPVLSPYAAIAGSLKDIHAVSDVVRRNENNGGFRLVFPHLATMPTVSVAGVVPDPEQILRLNPDAVLAWPVQSDVLRATGYPGLVELEWKGKEGYVERLWEFLGKLLSDEPRAARLWRDAQSQQQALRAGLPRANPIKVLIISPYDSASTWIGRKDYFLSPLLQGLGAQNLTEDFGSSGYVGPEQILRYEPDVVLVPSFVDDDDLSDIYGNPVWQSLRAVREKRVYLMPHTSMFNLAVDETLLSFWLAEILYPTLSPKARNIYRTVYADVYGRNLTDYELDDVLRLSKNAGAYGYERFRSISTTPDLNTPHGG
jgi:iron complex transport system substrate-binding protein